MEPLAVAFVLFFFVTIVLGPIFGAEDRPEFLRPDSRFRKMLTPSSTPEVAASYSEREVGVQVRQRGRVHLVCSVRKRRACSRSSERPTVSAATTRPSSM